MVRHNSIISIYFLYFLYFVCSTSSYQMKTIYTTSPLDCEEVVEKEPYQKEVITPATCHFGSCEGETRVLVTDYRDVVKTVCK